MSTSSMNENTKTLKSFFLIHVLVSIFCGVLALCFFKGDPLKNFLIGELLITLSLVSVGVAIYLGFYKKNIALLVSVIVFKWPILIYVVLKLVENSQASLGYIAAGFSTWIFSSLIWSVLHQKG